MGGDWQSSQLCMLRCLRIGRGVCDPVARDEAGTVLAFVPGVDPCGRGDGHGDEPIRGVFSGLCLFEDIVASAESMLLRIARDFS